MRIDRPHTVIGAAMLAMAVQASWTTSVAAAASSAVPFCVLTGGPRGPGSVPQICRFFDYQECLQAAANLRGNCVVNMDYHGPVTMPLGQAPVPDRPPRQRY